MAVIIDTATITKATIAKQHHEITHWQYNGLDSLVPHEILEKIQPKLDEDTQRIYDYERAKMGPALAMMMRGVLIDQEERMLQIYDLDNIRKKVEKWFARLCVQVIGESIKYRSYLRLQDLFYNKMGLPKQYKHEKGVKKLSTDRECLEKLKAYWYAVPLVNAILKLRDLDKQLQVLKSAVDDDGRIRCGFNPAATDTGRWSSSKNCFGKGTNGQNINEKMRRIFIADPGRKLAYPDLEQAESRGVAYMAQDLQYIDACESGDLHTYVARRIWPDLDWTGDLSRDRGVAEAPYYRHFTFRDMSKRGGHLTNYLGSPWMLAKALKIEQSLAEKFQETYFESFPGIARWHLEVQRELQQTGQLTTPMGRRRTFFGRLRDDATLRKAVAFLPQSLVVDIMDYGMLKAWYKYDLYGDGRIEVLLQEHDGFVFQYWEEDYEVLELVEDSMTCAIPIHGRMLTIPVATKVGYSWYRKLMAPPGSEKERAQVRPKTVDILDWQVS